MELELKATPWDSPVARRLTSGETDDTSAAGGPGEEKHGVARVHRMGFPRG